VGGEEDPGLGLRVEWFLFDLADRGRFFGIFRERKLEKREHEANLIATLDYKIPLNPFSQLSRNLYCRPNRYLDVLRF